MFFIFEKPEKRKMTLFGYEFIRTSKNEKNFVHMTNALGQYKWVNDFKSQNTFTKCINVKAIIFW